MHQIKIVARLNEGVDSEGVGFPESVTITGAGFLDPSAITDIAQEVVRSYYGTNHPNYIAIRPDSELIADDMVIPVVKTRVFMRSDLQT